VSEALQALLAHAGVWRGRRGNRGLPVQASGHAALDALLPGGGWPLGALSELVVECHGLGELRLLLPALRQRLGAQGGAGWLLWIAPPYIPYAPALSAAGIDLSHTLIVQAPRVSDALWAAEQALHSGQCANVLLWAHPVGLQGMRRLQLAAEAGRAMVVLFRPPAALGDSTVAALRLRLCPVPGGLRVHLLKSRGGRPAVLDLADFPLS